MENQYQTDQTEFVNDAPWQDQVVAPPVLEAESESSSTHKKPAPLVVALVVSSLVLVGLIVVAILLRPRTKIDDPSIVGGDDQVSRSRTPLQQEVASLSAELKKADPVKSEFPFPPVKMDLSLPTPSPKL